MITIGLTGGVASGKSSVAKLFSKLGVPLIDADTEAHQLLQQQHYQDAVIKHFGPTVKSDQGIDRRRLRQLIFEDATHKTWLESLLHPPIIERLNAFKAQHSNATYIVMVIPLLIETNLVSMVDRVCVVDCPEALQIDRLITRDGIDASLAQAMLNLQASRDERLQVATDIIENQHTLSDLRETVTQLHYQYLKDSQSN